MLKTQALVLSTLDYRETSLIIDFYSLEKGRLTGLINGVRKSKSKYVASYLQPGFMLDLVLYDRPSTKIHRIKEYAPVFATHDMLYNVYKSTVLTFVTEVIKHTTYKGHQDGASFEFINQYYRHVEQTSASIALLPSYFVASWLSYLGIGLPTLEDASGMGFDLRTRRPTHRVDRPDRLSIQATHLLYQVMVSSIDDLPKIVSTHGMRIEVLRALLQYLDMHHQGMKAVKSLDVLIEVFE